MKVVDIATKEIGYLEKKSNANLDSKTANAGSGNYTKYARDLDNIAGWYNGKKNGYPWCDVFVDWCFVQAYGVDKADKMINHDQLGAGVEYSAQYYKDAGRWYTSPKVGDQIFFKTSKSAWAHTGLVVAVSSSTITTIEGNTSGASGVIANGGGVCKKQYSRSYANIVGYGRPNYDLVDDKEKGEVCNVELPVLRQGSEGDSVKALQILLIGYGFSCGSAGADGDFGSATYSAVRTFQSKRKLAVDGVVGKNTWDALLL